MLTIVQSANGKHYVTNGAAQVSPDFDTLDEAQSWLDRNACESCEQTLVYRYGLCRACEHPDDTEFYDYDPGEEF